MEVENISEINHKKVFEVLFKVGRCLKIANAGSHGFQGSILITEIICDFQNFLYTLLNKCQDLISISKESIQYVDYGLKIIENKPDKFLEFISISSKNADIITDINIFLISLVDSLIQKSHLSVQNSNKDIVERKTEYDNIKKLKENLESEKNHILKQINEIDQQIIELSNCKESKYEIIKNGFLCLAAFGGCIFTESLIPFIISGLYIAVNKYGKDEFEDYKNLKNNYEQTIYIIGLNDEKLKKLKTNLSNLEKQPQNESICNEINNLKKNIEDIENQTSELLPLKDTQKEKIDLEIRKLTKKSKENQELADKLTKELKEIHDSINKSIEEKIVKIKSLLDENSYLEASISSLELVRKMMYSVSYIFQEIKSTLSVIDTQSKKMVDISKVKKLIEHEELKKDFIKEVVLLKNNWIYIHKSYNNCSNGIVKYKNEYHMISYFPTQYEAKMILIEEEEKIKKSRNNSQIKNE